MEREREGEIKNEKKNERPDSKEKKITGEGVKYRNKRIREKDRKGRE